MLSIHVYDWKLLFKAHDYVLLGSCPEFPCWKRYTQKISGYATDYCRSSFNKAWIQVLQRFISCLQRVGDLWRWGCMTLVLAGNKAKHLSSVNHSTKTNHHHHHVKSQYNPSVPVYPSISGHPVVSYHPFSISYFHVTPTTYLYLFNEKLDFIEKI